MKKLISILTIFIALIGCEEKSPIQEEKLILVYSDIMFVQDTSAVTAANLDSLKLLVFERHKISNDDYNRAIDYYNEVPERWELFFDKVIVHVESLKTKYSAKPSI